MRPASALALRRFADARTRTISFGLLFLFVSAAVVIGYRDAYPTRAERIEFARSFGGNKGIRLLYGVPHDLLTPGGYAGWRLVGGMSIFAALWGLLGAVRALRTEEDAGRQELVLAGAVHRRTAFAASLAAIAGGAALLWLVVLGGVLAGRENAGASAYLALTVISPLPVFVGVGAVASQLAPTRRGAVAIATSVLGLALLVRMLADTVSGLGWLRWSTPLGWAEEMRAFADPRPLVLVLPALTSTLLLVASARISMRRDVGAGLLPARDSAEATTRLLGSPTALAIRTLRGGFLAWVGGIAAYALIMGFISDSVSSGLSKSLQEQLEKLGVSGADTPTGFLGFAFLFSVVAISVFDCFELAAVREEEAEQRLETLLTQPISRIGWLAERLALIAAAAAVLALGSGLLAWLGAVSAGADVSFLRMLEAGVNCLPVTVLFLGLGALALALVPRAGVWIAYALVGAAFVWETVGGLLDVPGWMLSVSPFQHVALVPAESFAAGSAAVMVALGLGAMLGALVAFRQRDLIGT